MENKIDQFFKDKLAGHTLPPSEEAWAKVEANLSKKNNVAAWRIAAAIIIAGALITAILWSQHSGADRPAIAAKQLQKDPSTKENTAPQNSSDEKKKREALPHQSYVSADHRAPTQHKLPNRNGVVTQDAPPAELKPAPAESVATVEKFDQEEKKNQDATPPVAIASTHQKPIKLEFTLEEFSSEPPVATAGEEKPSGLKKVWELAREVKNGDGPVRDIKNEIFALNFKKNNSGGSQKK